MILYGVVWSFIALYGLLWLLDHGEIMPTFDWFDKVLFNFGRHLLGFERVEYKLVF